MHKATTMQYMYLEALNQTIASTAQTKIYIAVVSTHVLYF